MMIDYWRDRVDATEPECWLEPEHHRPAWWRELLASLLERLALRMRGA